MQERCKSCTYSRAMNRDYPRKCVKCYHYESNNLPKTVSLQDQALSKLKKLFMNGATIRNTPGCIKLNVYKLLGNDLESLKVIEGMYKEITIKRSGTGVVVILNF